MTTPDSLPRPEPSQALPRREPGHTLLSPLAIVDRALHLMTGDGSPPLTVRRLGQELGVDPTAFYRHFRDKDDLVLAVLDRAEERVADRLDARPSHLTWQAILLLVADEVWEAALVHPAVFASSFARTTGGPGERRLVELLLSVIAGLGLPPTATVLFYRSFADTLLSLCGARASVTQLGPAVADKDATTWTRVYSRLPASSAPATRVHAHELAAVGDREVYDHTIGMMITAMEQAANRGQSPRGVATG